MTARGLNALLMLIILCSATVGCVVGQRQSFANVQVAIDPGTTAIALAVVDRRPYVVSGETSPTYVGSLRNTFGRPFDVTTESGVSLAKEIAAILERSLSAMGHKVFSVPTRPNRARQKIATALTRTKADRLLLLTVKEWSSDTYVGTGLTYDLTLEVLDSSGGLVAQTAISGQENLGWSLHDPHGIARQAAPEALGAKLGSLLNSAGVVAALKALPAAVEAPTEEVTD